jgi:hypothetical protein
MLNNSFAQITVQKNGNNIAIGLEGSPEQITNTFTMFYNAGVTDATEPNTLGGDRFAYIFSTPRKLEKGFRTIAHLKVLREEGHKGHQGKVNKLTTEWLTGLNYGTFLQRNETLTPAEIGVLEGMK